MKKLFLFIFNIFKGIGKLFSFIRSCILNLFLIAILALIVFSFYPKDEPVVPPNSILQLTISGNIVEQKSAANSFDQSFGEYLGFSSLPHETLLQDILDTIYAAENDSNITAILLDLSEMGSAGMNQLAVIGKALNQFRKSGKPVIAAEDVYNQNQYYLAAHCNKIYLNPLGFVHLTGFGLYRLYFQEALEKLKINYNVFRVGSFKSAVEPFTRNSMSPEDRAQSRAWLSNLWDNYIATVSSVRSMESEKIFQYINDIPENLKAVDGDMAKLALEAGLVDEIAPHHEIREYLQSISGHSVKNGYQSVSFNHYLNTFAPSHNYTKKSQDTVAIIVAQGTIMPGQSGHGIIGADSVVKLIRKAAESPHIKAVVLRIDSGGGSAFASEVIRQELLEFKKKNKPLVVSMGTLAASGAYWLSADADEIWASPDTLTGSIGIFMALPTFERLLDFGGIHRDGVGTTNLSGALDLSKPLSPEIKETLQLTLNKGYNTFLSIVSNGRNLPIEKVEEIAQGKIFSGPAALEAGLVDQLGSLEPAIKSAADLAGLDSYKTMNLRTPLSFRERIFQKFGSQFSSLQREEIGLLRYLEKLFPRESELQSLLLFRDPNGMYAHCMISY